MGHRSNRIAWIHQIGSPFKKIDKQAYAQPQHNEYVQQLLIQYKEIVKIAEKNYYPAVKYK